MGRQEQQQRKMIGIIATCIAIVLGGVLLATSLLYSADARPTSSQAPARPQQPFTEAPAHSTPPPLPTIFAPTPIAPLPNASSGLRRSSALQGEDDPSATKWITASSDDLAARLANDLTCLQQEVQHIARLDIRAAELAKDDTTAVPQTGVIHLKDTQGHRFLLGFDMVANLQIEHPRCGETLIFGVPPLEWLPQGSRFGIGISTRPEGLVIVVITGR